MPTTAPDLATSECTLWRERRLPRLLRNTAEVETRGLTSSGRQVSRYSESTLAAVPTMGTTRSLLPLPTTRRTCSSSITRRRSRPHSSETRSPQP